MNDWIKMLITSLVTVLACSGFWTYQTKRLEMRLARQDQQSLETKVLIGLGHDRIMYLGMKYIERGYVRKDEYENLFEYLYKPYEQMGGNGSAKRIMSEVEKLPIRE